MTRNWLSIRVELVEGSGERLWPRPGRIFAAAQSHTFAALATAIDGAFARWDRAHLHEFRLADGTRLGQRLGRPLTKVAPAVMTPRHDTGSPCRQIPVAFLGRLAISGRWSILPPDLLLARLPSLCARSRSFRIRRIDRNGPIAREPRSVPSEVSRSR